MRHYSLTKTWGIHSIHLEVQKCGKNNSGFNNSSWLCSARKQKQSPRLKWHLCSSLWGKIGHSLTIPGTCKWEWKRLVLFSCQKPMLVNRMRTLVLCFNFLQDTYSIQHHGLVMGHGHWRDCVWLCVTVCVSAETHPVHRLRRERDGHMYYGRQNQLHT
jgi:hypothetical protein